MLGQIGQGYAARRSADAQAQMAADQAAELRQEGIDRAAAIRKAAGKVRSSATAAYAASGVRVGEGTPATVDASIIADSEADAYAAILTGRRRGRSLPAATRPPGRRPSAPAHRPIGVPHTLGRSARAS
jgi:hypothetical protein